MMTDKLIEMAKASGAQIENWLTNTPKVGGLYFTPHQLESFANLIRADERSKYDEVGVIEPNANGDGVARLNENYWIKFNPSCVIHDPVILLIKRGE